MPELKMARMLLKLAAEDMTVLNLLLEEERMPIRPSGFHAQQAVEKALKAWLVFLDEDYPLTHSLFALLELVRKSGADCGKFESLAGLTPYAVELRYDTAVPDVQVDPAAVAPTVADLLSYVRELLTAAEAGE